jgi:flagellar biosynthetic protein FliR
MTIEGLDPQRLLICLMRTGGFMFAAPVFGSRFIPLMVRVWFAVLVAFVLVHATGQSGPLPAFGSIAYCALAAREVLLGVMMGFVATIFIQGVEFAGHLLGLQMGLGTSTIFDPMTNNEVSVVATFKSTLAVTLFLVMNGHHVLLSSLAWSYDTVPIALSGFPAAAVGSLVSATATIFTVAVRVAMPALSALLMAEVGLALLAKTMPQMNIFVVGFPVKIALGLGIIGLSIPYFSHVLGKVMNASFGDLRSLLGALAGG